MKANDQVGYTPGSGVNIATHTIDGKGHNVVVLAEQDGHLAGSKPVYVVQTGNDTNVANTTTIHFEMFNGDGAAIVEILALYIIPTLTAVTGVGLTWLLERTSAVGTGGTGLTPVKADTASPNLDSDITARAKPSGGATSGDTLLTINTSSEETSPYATAAANINHVEAFKQMFGTALTLNPGQGLKLTKTLSSAVGSTNVVCAFAVK